ncbi:MAG: diguanylate cyclase (GGDEF)-like protein [Candidatus Endobugula sp.]|jgi:diguanylate cyclase (GGDEF)-like protein
MGLAVKKHQQRRHLLIYGVILMSIALISFKIYFILEKAFVVQKEAAYIINLSGRQRMLSQRIIVEAIDHQIKSSAASTASLKDSISKMQTAHKFLTFTAAAPKKIKNLYFHPTLVDEKVKRYLSFASAILKDSDDEESLFSLRSMSKNLLADLDKIVFEYQKDAQNKTHAQHKLQLLLLLLIFSLLIIKVFLVIFPIYKNSKYYFQLAIKDTLTGLHNRRYFLQALEEEHHRCSRYNTIYSLCMIDIDHFKRVNDQYGHPIGDKILQEVAQTIKKEVRTSDQCCRIGGEEFAVLLIGANGGKALSAIEKLREKIEASTHFHKGVNISTTISAGIASYLFSTEDIEGVTLTTSDMMRQADTALYLAKESGRNTIHLWNNSTEKPTIRPIKTI